VAESDDKVTPPTLTPAAVSPQRSKTIGILAILAGLAAAVVGLINVLSNRMDLVDILLFIGGLLVAVVGLGRLRKARAEQA